MNPEFIVKDLALKLAETLARVSSDTKLKEPDAKLLVRQKLLEFSQLATSDALPSYMVREIFDYLTIAEHIYYLEDPDTIEGVETPIAKMITLFREVMDYQVASYEFEDESLVIVFRDKDMAESYRRKFKTIIDEDEQGILGYIAVFRDKTTITLNYDTGS